MNIYLHEDWRGGDQLGGSGRGETECVSGLEKRVSAGLKRIMYRCIDI